jgi:hypothetical protein
MALKANLTADEFGALPEALREHYSEQGDAGYWLDAEGVEDVSGLKSALGKEKEERRKLKAQLDSFKDLDPEAAREALAKIRELDDKKLVDKGQYERVLQKRMDEFAAEKAQFEARLAEANGRLDVYDLVNPIREAALRAGIPGDRIDDALSASSKRFKLDDKRKPQVLDSDGDPTGMTLDEFFTNEFKSSKPWFYPGKGGGTGAQANSNGGAVGIQRVWTRGQWDSASTADRTSFSKAGGKVVD